MNGRQFRYLLLIAICFGMFWPLTAHGVPITYVYTGNTFTDLTNNSGSIYQYTTSDFLTMTLVTTDGSLTDNSGVVDITAQLQSWSFTDGQQTLDSSMVHDHVFIGASISGGTLVAWDMVVESAGYADPTSGAVGYRFQTQMIPISTQDRATTTIGIGGGYSLNRGVVENNVGSWEIQSQQPVPEPTTLILLGTGLASLAYIRRSKRS